MSVVKIGVRRAGSDRERRYSGDGGARCGARRHRPPEQWFLAHAKEGGRPVRISAANLRQSKVQNCSLTVANGFNTGDIGVHQ